MTTGDRVARELPAAVRGQVFLQLGAARRERIGAWLLLGWLALSVLGFQAGKRVPLVKLLIGAMVIFGPLVLSGLFAAVPWWLQRRRRASSFGGPRGKETVKLEEIDGWHATDAKRVVLVSMKTGDVLWFFPQDDAAMNATRTWLSPARPDRIRVSSHPTHGIAGVALTVSPDSGVRRGRRLGAARSVLRFTGVLFVDVLGGDRLSGLSSSAASNGKAWRNSGIELHRREERRGRGQWQLKPARG